VIKHDWRDRLSRGDSAELAALLTRAARHDAGPEYNTIDFADVRATLGQPHTRHLLIWLLPGAVVGARRVESQRIAGLLRMEFGTDGVTEATLVIDPELRSIGIATLLLEELGVDAGAARGWAGTGAHTITGWARGNHPAVGRIGDRFLIPRTRHRWKLTRSAGSVESGAAVPVLEPLDRPASCAQKYDGELLALREAGKVVALTSLDLRPVDSPGFGVCGTITCIGYGRHTDRSSIRRLLAGAVARAYEAGLGGITICVDSHDARLVEACRLSGFEHDRTDVCYQLGAYP
jgi:mycothiol synthase